jgi:hypothetical protein
MLIYIGLWLVICGHESEEKTGQTEVPDSKLNKLKIQGVMILKKNN